MGPLVMAVSLVFTCQVIILDCVEAVDVQAGVYFCVQLVLYQEAESHLSFDVVALSFCHGKTFSLSK